MPDVEQARLDEEQRQIGEDEEDGEPHAPAIGDRQQRAPEHQ